jgi:hypothetical protein
VSWQNGFCVASARLDTTTSGGSCGNGVGFDVPAGTLYCITEGGYGNCWGSTDVADDFVLLGPASGTPVGLSVEMAISTSSFGGALASGKIQRDNTSLAEWNHLFPDGDPSGQSDSTLDAPLQVLAGVPFRLHFILGASAGGDAIFVQSEATFSFAGLASGQHIESCKGYSQFVTPVLPVTWGKVKGLYR